MRFANVNLSWQMLASFRPSKLLKTSSRTLKIDNNHKDIVRTLVKVHLEKQSRQRQQNTVGLNQDLFQGKGSGLIILLHGVGKTATAEAVAQANKKPLFVITSDDLGFTPKEVDVALRGIFRLAYLWDCVLLLDEAEIFLARQNVNELKRNALVSGNDPIYHIVEAV